mgnify:CR=1 FL=1
MTTCGFLIGSRPSRYDAWLKARYQKAQEDKEAAAKSAQQASWSLEDKQREEIRRLKEQDRVVATVRTLPL